MFRVRFCDLEKAFAALHEVVKDDLFCKIENNAYGDFIFKIDNKTIYAVKHDDFTVWRQHGNRKNPDWREVK